MRYLIWSLRILLFLLLLGFAVKNDVPVALSYFFGFEWHTSLIVLLLGFFALGIAVGLLAMLGSLLRQRREITSLRRELHLKNAPAASGSRPVVPQTAEEQPDGI